MAILVFDNVLRDPYEYRAQALAQRFDSVAVGGDTFQGIAEAPTGELGQAFRGRMPAEAKTTFLRLSPAGQREPNFIHSDADMGRWTGILYLNPEPPALDGTTFWRHGELGERGPWTPEARMAAGCLAGWEAWRHVEARFNRLLVFASDLFHSRAILDNYGEGSGARLIQVAFA